MKFRLRTTLKWMGYSAGLLVVLGVSLVVYELNKYDPLRLVACIESDTEPPAVIGWACFQVLKHKRFTPSQVAELNANAGAFDPASLEDERMAEEALRIYLEQGVLIDAVAESSVSRTTALHTMISFGNVKGVELLLRHGARTDLKGPWGMTPAEFARDQARKHPEWQQYERIAAILDSAAKARAGQ